MLRIKVLNDLKPRLTQGIKLQLEKTKTIQERVEVAKKVAVKRNDAEIIMSALGLSYNLGASTVEQVLDRLGKEDKSQWGMSMASSWVARHGESKSREQADSKVTQKLSTISGAALMLDKIPEAKKKSIEWLNGHIKLGESKSLEQLADRLKLWEKKQP